MTLNEIIKIIKKIGSLQPNINSTTEGSIYEVLNAAPDVNYANFHITQNKHNTDNHFITYNFIFFYTDRLMDDNSNKLSIQSIGIELLGNIIRTLSNNYDEMEISNTDFQPFTERFSDNCAGIYSNVSISVPIEYVCEETFGNQLMIDGNECEIRNEFIEVNVTENGRLVINYGPNYTGIERVIINTAVKRQGLRDIVITENGVYEPDIMEFDGYYKIDVDIQPELEDITITENGEYKSDKYGYNNVNVDIPRSSVFNGMEGYAAADRDKLVSIVDKDIEYTNQLLSEWDPATKGANNKYNGDYKMVYAPVIDTSNLTYANYMFANCSNLRYVPHYEIGNMISMIAFFYNNRSLMYIDCENWDVRNVTDMGMMFFNCESLTSLNLSKWKLDKIKWVNEMFDGCTSIKTINISNWDLSKLTDTQKMNNMFYYCSELENLICDNLKLPNIDLGLAMELRLCKKLTIDSLVGLLTALPESIGNGYTFSIGDVNLAKLSPEQIAIATTKGWTIN